MTALETRRRRADRGDDGERLDRVLVRHLADLPGVSRADVQRWIGAGRVRIGGVPATKSSHKVAVGDHLEVDLPPPPPPPPELPPEALDLTVLHEDDRLLAVSKPAGMLVHPTPGARSGTLLAGLLHLARDTERPELASFRPRLFHRLDRDTSGVLLVTKDREIHAALARELSAGRIEKRYLAVAYFRRQASEGLPEPERGRIDRPIGRDPHDPRLRVVDGVDAKASVTRYRIRATSAERAGPLALVEAEPVTGRNHQIRVHLAARGWPLVGDPLYGEPRWKGIDDPHLAGLCRELDARGRQALHAWRLAFTHPATGRRLEIEAPLPEDLARLVRAAGLPERPEP